MSGMDPYDCIGLSETDLRWLAESEHDKAKARIAELEEEVESLDGDIKGLEADNKRLREAIKKHRASIMLRANRSTQGSKSDSLLWSALEANE